MNKPVSQTITQQSASNLAQAFILLPQARREAMAALYAFCRRVDDIADDETESEETRRQQLTEWREDIERACSSGEVRFDVNRELVPIIRQYRLPFTLFDELIRGVEQDLEVKRYADWPDLEQYCYLVASVVGLLSIEIFGYSDPVCRDYAVSLGKALQLTNILRDVQADAERGRIYLPQSELKRFRVEPEEILRGEYSTRYRDLAACVAARAGTHYDQARAVLPASDRRSMIAAELMGAVYWRLLSLLKSRQYDVFTAPRTRVSTAGKIYLILRTWVRLSWNLKTPNYGTA